MIQRYFLPPALFMLTPDTPINKIYTSLPKNRLPLRPDRLLLRRQPYEKEFIAPSFGRIRNRNN